MSYRALITLSFFTLAVLAGGCRRVYTYAPVEGTITKNGQPLAKVQVIFFPDPDSGTEGPRSCGITDNMGHYRLATDHGDDGVVVGKHHVCIVELLADDNRRAFRRRKETASSESNQAPSPKQRPGPKVPADPRVPEIYGQFSKTPLQADVRPGGLQTLDFNIP